MDNGPVFEFGRDIFAGETIIGVDMVEPWNFHSFICGHCGEKYMTHTTEEEANKEYLESRQPLSEGISSVCDDCYDYLMARAREDGLLS